MLEGIERLMTGPTVEAAPVVLVVDDEPIVRMLVVETVEDLGYVAREAADGTAALHMLDSGERIDLLVSDIGLPGLNGRQLAQAARATRPELPVLLMTGYAHTTAGPAAALQPGVEIISKPFALTALARRVRAMIENL